MLQPGSRGWVKKYFHLVEKGEIDLSFQKPKHLSEEHFIHPFLGQTGLNFGYASKMLFAKDLDGNHWTNEEKLKLLLFEAHIFVFKLVNRQKKFNQKVFIQTVLDFYGKHNSYSITRIFSFFLKEENDEKLENILSKRVDLKVGLLDHRIWLNSLSNVFVYLDVILFYNYLKNERSFSDYNQLAVNALNAIILSAYSDGAIQETEKSMFKIFLASAHLQDDQKEIILKRFKKGAKYEDFTLEVFENRVFKQFILDLSILTIYSKNQTHISEKEFLNNLCIHLKISDQSLNESIVVVEKFVLENHDKVAFLQANSSYEIMYGSLSKHWLKVLGRNKEKLATELKQSKELIFLIKKSTTEDLTKEEKEIVKTQFLDIVKSMPSLAIFMLPGGAFLLPMLLKVVPDLVPSAFRDNEIEKNKPKSEH